MATNYSGTSDKGPSEMGATSLQFECIIRDRGDLSTKDSCFNFSVLFDLRDRDDLSTRDKIVGPIMWRFHCISMYTCVLFVVAGGGSGAGG